MKHRVRASALRAAAVVLAVVVAAPAYAQTARVQPESRRDCALCHLDWMDAFNAPPRQAPTLLIDRPAASIVTDPATCLGCHDGSVADSRRSVWLEHGHQVGVVPSAAVHVPRTLPLTDGRMTCRTCHTAHASAGPVTLATAVFLRIPDGDGPLCTSCHAAKTGGPSHGMHPIGALPYELPAALVAAGARTGSKRDQITCQVCHVAHGAEAEPLLTMKTSDNGLCATCHIGTQPGQFTPGAPGVHPLNPVLAEPARRAAVAQMGGRLGDGDRLACISCHRSHEARPDSFLLMRELSGGEFCLGCHADAKRVLATPHNLAKTAPHEANLRGMTAEQGGACSACHLFHQFARKPSPQPNDPTGNCSSCHAQGQCAARFTIGEHSHPVGVVMSTADTPRDLPLAHVRTGGVGGVAQGVDCTTCHEPHGGTAHPSFLRTAQKDMCTQCHAAQETVAGGVHDVAARPNMASFRNALGQPADEVGVCGACHAPHNARGPSLWAGPTPGAPPDDANAVCASCHRAGGLASASPVAPHNHPMGAATAGSPTLTACPLPLYDANGRRRDAGTVACASCHDAHALSRTNAALLRGSAVAADVCTSCHRDQRELAGGVHDVTRMAANASAGAAAGTTAQPSPSQARAAWPERSRKQADVCLACHQPHAATAEGRFTAGMTDDTLGSACRACHADPGWASWPAWQTQASSVDASGSTPRVILAHATQPIEGHETQCVRCHNPHAAKDNTRLLRAEPPDEPRRACFQCHKGPEFQRVEQTAHGSLHVAPHGATATQCGACHNVHAPAAVAATTITVEAAVAGLPPRDLACVACHAAPDAARPLPKHFSHPALPIVSRQTQSDAGFLPLVAADGKLGAQGIISCSTCHTAHGRAEANATAASAMTPAIGAATTQPTTDAPSGMPAALLGAPTVPLHRRYLEPNICTDCHGREGLSRFLYFHRWAERPAGAASTATDR